MTSRTTSLADAIAALLGESMTRRPNALMPLNGVLTTPSHSARNVLNELIGGLDYSLAGRSQPSAGNILEDLAAALATPSHPSLHSPALDGLFRHRAAPAPGNHFSHFQSPTNPPAAALVPATRLSPLAPATIRPAAARHVFYSFHYDDIFRVNQVRKSGKIRPADKGRNLTVRDRSLWERVKRANPAALRRIIDAGLANTSVTCVLAGTWTWSREWVRYEIARSLFRGNGLLTVDIHQCPHPLFGITEQGPDPLAFMALGWNARIYELTDRGWDYYDKIRQPLDRWPQWLERPDRDHVMPLASATARYDWTGDDGYNQLIQWTNAAARRAGR